MKKISILTLFIVFRCSPIYSQDTIYSFAFSDYLFDFNDRPENYFFKDTSQINNLWQIGTPSKVFFNEAYSLPLALVTDTTTTYPINVNSSFEFAIYTDDNTEVWFWQKYDTDSLKDGGIIELSTDDGNSWTNVLNTFHLFPFYNFYSNSDTISSNIAQPGFTGRSQGWVRSSFNFHPGSSSQVIRIRFTFTSDSIDNNKDGWMIDDIEITTYFVGISDYRKEIPFKIFPNPSSGKITIENTENSHFFSATIKDLMGRSILTSHTHSIDLTHLEKGIYLVEIKDESTSHFTKLIIK